MIRLERAVDKRQKVLAIGWAVTLLVLLPVVSLLLARLVGGG